MALMVNSVELTKIRSELDQIMAKQAKTELVYSPEQLVSGGSVADERMHKEDTRQTMEALKGHDPKSLDLKDLEIRERIAQSAYKRASGLHGWDGKKAGAINLAILSR